MRRSFFLGIFFAVFSCVSAHAQEYRITDSSCIGWFRGPNGQDVPAASISASVPEWQPYVPSEQRSKLTSAILREFIPRCVQSGSKPLVFNLRVSASNVPMRTMYHVRYYVDKPNSERLQVVSDSIPEFMQAEVDKQQAEIARRKKEIDAREKAKVEQETAANARQKEIDDKRIKDKADEDAYKEQLSKAKEMERAADEAAAARAKAKPADSFCMWSCDPLEANGRQVLRNQIAALFPTIVVIKNFALTQGAKMTIAGSSVFEMRYSVDLDFPVGFAAKPTSGFWNEMELVQRASNGFMQLNELMRLTQRTKGPKWWDPASYSATGAVRFLKTDRGWMGPDDKLYN